MSNTAFSEDHLRSKGFVQDKNGNWSKPLKAKNLTEAVKEFRKDEGMGNLNDLPKDGATTDSNQVRSNGLKSGKNKKGRPSLKSNAIEELAATSTISLDDGTIRINIKPLSQNRAFGGRKYKTDEHREYCKIVSKLLPDDYNITLPPYEIHFKFGFSSFNSDVDNPTKIIQDILAEKYGFNDRHVMKLVIEKVIVCKGSEFIDFKILKYEQDLP